MKFFNLKALKSIDPMALLASGRQCGVAFVIAAVVHSFLGPGPVGEAIFTGVFGLILLLVGSIKISGGNAK